jgi:hypothetical protein
MRFTRVTSIAVLVGAALVAPSAPAAADPIVWNGPSIAFTKPDFADWTLATNQDRLTDNVSLTRGGNRSLFNAVLEEFPDATVSPLDTEWAFGPTQPGHPGPITANNYANLTFAPFVPALEHLVGSNVVRYGPGVLHLISNDIYLDIKFTSWTQETGGGFSYIRSTPGETPVPEPSSAALVLAGALAWAGKVAARRTRKEKAAGL